MIQTYKADCTMTADSGLRIFNKIVFCGQNN